jgi:hypothetical protein
MDEAYVSAHVSIEASTVPGAGMGVFWRGPAPLPANRIVGTYKGVSMPEPPADTTYTLFVEEPPPGRYVDAADVRTANWTRYMNDPRGTGRPFNVVFTRAGRVKTITRVRPGDELLVPYGSDYWTEHT